ncbi:MAG: hypothetical protein QOH96_4159 [Blastocatellia bacterium]|nr:hypothetical protein [Blastocatellia bacterium]
MGEVWLEFKRVQIMNSKTKTKNKKKKRTAMVICKSGKSFWTTQVQFWQWVRTCAVKKTADNPLVGQFIREDEENLILLSHTVLNLSCPNHLSEALSSRRFGAFR